MSALVGWKVLKFGVLGGNFLDPYFLWLFCLLCLPFHLPFLPDFELFPELLFFIGVFGLIIEFFDDLLNLYCFFGDFAIRKGIVLCHDNSRARRYYT